MSVTGLILAAGESRRMGRPKALLEFRGATFLDTLIGLFSAHCSPVVVVLGAAEEEIRAATARQAEFVLNPDYGRGQTSSMQCGLRAAPPETAGVLFTLVDHPAVSAETIERLVAPAVVDDPWETHRRQETTAGATLRVPRYRGRRGHPIWFSRKLIPEFLALPQSGAARDVVERHAAETEFLDLDDPGIVADIDDPAAYRSLEGKRP